MSSAHKTSSAVMIHIHLSARATTTCGYALHEKKNKSANIVMDFVALVSPTTDAYRQICISITAVFTK